MYTCICGKSFEESAPHYEAFDLQKGYEKVELCSKECLNEWLRKKKTGMWATFLLGVVLAVALLFDRGTPAALSLLVLFLPYAIRQLKGSLAGSGEFLSFAIVLICCLTVVYPAYKLVQEFLLYRRLSKL